jgi:hypothetical protein
MANANFSFSAGLWRADLTAGSTPQTDATLAGLITKVATQFGTTVAGLQAAGHTLTNVDVANAAFQDSFSPGRYRPAPPNNGNGPST